jgi:hypothetical protein
MHPSRCGRLTRDIGLVLISSSLILCGCTVRPDDDEKKKKDDQDPAQATTGHRSGVSRGFYFGTIGRGVGTNGAGRGGGSTSSVGSVRGGFGATGHGVAAGS